MESACKPRGGSRSWALGPPENAPATNSASSLSPILLRALRKESSKKRKSSSHFFSSMSRRLCAGAGSGARPATASVRNVLIWSQCFTIRADLYNRGCAHVDGRTVKIFSRPRGGSRTGCRNPIGDQIFTQDRKMQVLHPAEQHGVKFVAGSLQRPACSAPARRGRDSFRVKS